MGEQFRSTKRIEIKHVKRNTITLADLTKYRPKRDWTDRKETKLGQTVSYYETKQNYDKNRSRNSFALP